MTDRPIAFSAPMVRALLEGRKTQTRRLLCDFDPDRDPPFAGPYMAGHKAATWTDREGTPWRYPGAKGAATGDRLWVKEDLICATVQLPASDSFADVVCYAHDGKSAKRAGELVDWPWKRDTLGSRFCPRWASRLTPTVTDVRVQRLQDISEADALAEGVESLPDYWVREDAHIGGSNGDWIPNQPPVPAYRDLWNSLHGPDAWDQNPWVVALTFTVQHGNIDQIGRAA